MRGRARAHAPVSLPSLQMHEVDLLDHWPTPVSGALIWEVRLHINLLDDKRDKEACAWDLTPATAAAVFAARRPACRTSFAGRSPMLAVVLCNPERVSEQLAWL